MADVEHIPRSWKTEFLATVLAIAVAAGVAAGVAYEIYYLFSLHVEKTCLVIFTIVAILIFYKLNKLVETKDSDYSIQQHDNGAEEMKKKPVSGEILKEVKGMDIQTQGHENENTGTGIRGICDEGENEDDNGAEEMKKKPISGETSNEVKGMDIQTQGHTTENIGIQTQGHGTENTGTGNRSICVEEEGSSTDPISPENTPVDRPKGDDIQDKNTEAVLTSICPHSSSSKNKHTKGDFTKVHTKKKNMFRKWFEFFLPSHKDRFYSPSIKLDMEAYKAEIRERGVTGIKEKLRKDLNDWQSIELNTGVTGNSGSGKSSFVNAIRGLTAKDKGAANVGPTETTVDCQSYEHPLNKSFIVWDLPGVGTPKFPKNKYMEMVGYDKYDFFVIISRGRFTENDMWLARQVQEQKKKFFFVRANIDSDVSNNKADDPKNHNEQTLLNLIRKDIENNLRQEGIKDPKIFLISNRERNKYDFGKLNNELLASCDGLKKEMMALSLESITKEVLWEKKRILGGRIDQIAMDVTCSRSEFEEKARFQNEIIFYQKQFNIDDVTLAENKDILPLSNENLKEFRVVFDEYTSEKEIEVTTPTARKQDASFGALIVDFFSSKKKTLLYKYCQIALKSNLDLLYDQACNLYDAEGTEHFVNAIMK